MLWGNCLTHQIAAARVTLFRDMSGASLHRRGYRGAMHAAALNEAAAAGVLALAGWPKLCEAEGARTSDLKGLVAALPLEHLTFLSSQQTPSWHNISFQHPLHEIYEKAKACYFIRRWLLLLQVRCLPTPCAARARC